MPIDTLNAAISAHHLWLNRFEIKFKSVSNEQFNLELIRDDHACIFGNWLFSDEAKALIPLESYLSIVSTHAIFHRLAHTAAQVANLGGNNYEGNILLKELEKVSARLTTLLEENIERLSDGLQTTIS